MSIFKKSIFRKALDFFPNQYFAVNRGVTSNAAQHMWWICEQRNTVATKSNSKKRSLERSLLLISCFLFMGMCVFHKSYADTLDTQLSHEKVTLGETLTISFSLNSNANSISPDFSPLEKDFHIIRKNYGHTINIINGVRTTQNFWQLTLEPKKTGEWIIPEINFGDLKSASRKLMVEEASHQVTPDHHDSPVFIQAKMSSMSPYIQSQVLYTFKLFYQVQLENPKVEIPDMKDITIVPLDEGKNYQTTIDGKLFHVVEKSFALFPQKAGKISIPPLHFRAIMYDNTSRTMYDPFTVSVPRAITLATKAFTLDVKKIPEIFKGQSWLPAYNLSLKETWSNPPGQWELGNPVTRTLTVEAEGLRADQIPDFIIKQIPGINIYADPAKRKNQTLGKKVVGTLEQKVTYIPNISQPFLIPNITLTWWNVEKNKNAIAELHAITASLNATKPFVAETKTPHVTFSQTQVMTEHTETKPKANPFSISIWFWIALFFMLSWITTLWFIWKKKPKSNTPKSNTPKSNTPRIKPVVEIHKMSFEKACEEGNPVLAQHYLLSWAKKRWGEESIHLATLGEMTQNISFKEALNHLEQAIYAKKATPWNGHALWIAYQEFQKDHKKNRKKIKNPQTDLLPPLNPL